MDKQSSEILGASPNCRLRHISHFPAANKKIDNQLCVTPTSKKNSDEDASIPMICTSDFMSDMEDENFSKLQSPPSSLVNSPVKVQNSPVLSKRRKGNVKKNNSSTSNTSSHSATSSNDSKINYSNVAVIYKKNSQEMDAESNKEIDTFSKDSNRSIKELGRECKESDRLNKKPDNLSKEPDKQNKDSVGLRKESDLLSKDWDRLDKEPLKQIENTCMSTTTNSEDKNKAIKVLVVSKSNYGKTSFVERGKKFRQSTLTSQLAIPVIDISKAESDTNPSDKNGSECRMNSAWSETFFNNDVIGQSKNDHEPKDIQNKQLNRSNEKNDLPKVTSDSVNQFNMETNGNQSLSEKDDELIETSPAQSEKSNLRNKLNLHKRIKKNKGSLQIKTPQTINNKAVADLKAVQKTKPMQLKSVKNLEPTCFSDSKSASVKKTSIFQTSKTKIEILKSEKRKVSKPHQTLNDETYFSPAEMDIGEDHISDCDEIEYENEMKNEAPPVKKMLLTSFDM